MKIGIVCPYSVAKGGGVQEHVYEQRAELLRRGHEAYVITPRPQDFNGEIPPHTIFVGGGADFNAPTHTTIQISGSLSENIHNMLREEQFDILHVHEPWVPMLGMQLLSRSNCVNVATFHAKLPETMMTRTMVKVITPYTKSVLKYIDAYTAVSEAAADYISSLTDAPIAIIPNGINPAKFSSPTSFKDGRKHKTILYVGRLEGRKGVKYLLHAFRLLCNRRSDVSLIIAGNGPDREKLEALAADLELDRVTFKGYISDEEKVRLLQQSDLFCAPSLFGESFGIVLVEAMASGLVTVAGDNPGYESVMRGLGALSLINPKHGAEFARRLELLLFEKDLRRLWRDWAVAEMPQYTYKAIVDQYEEVYIEALANAKKHA